MPFIKVNTQGVNGLCSSVRGVKNKNSECYSNLSRVKSNLQWKVQARSNISGRINTLQRRVNAQQCKLDAYIRVLQSASNTFYEKDRQISRDARDLTYELRRMRFLSANPLKTKRSSKSNAKIDEISKTNSLFNLGNDGLESIFLKFFKSTSSIIGGIGSITDKFDKTKAAANEFAFTSGILSYAGALVKTFGGKYKNGYDATANWFSLIKSSAKMESGIYKYYMKKLEVNDAFKLYSKSGNLINGVNIVGSVAGTISQAIKTVKTARDGNSSGSDIAASYIDLFSAGTSTIGTTQIISKYGKEILDYSKKKVVPVDAVGKKAAGAQLSLVTSIFDAGSSGVRKYGEVTEDGKFDLGDAGAIGMAAGINGLVSIVPGGSAVEGIIEATTGKNADDLVNGVLHEFDEIDTEAHNWLDEHQFVKSYLADESESRFLRNVVGCAVSAYSTIDHFQDLSTGWIKKLFDAA